MWDLFDTRICRVCGCTTEAACVDDAGRPCAWLADDLCSGCVPS